MANNLRVIIGGTPNAQDGTDVSEDGARTNPLIFTALNTPVDAYLRCDDGFWTNGETLTLPAELEISFDGGGTWKGVADNPIAIPEIEDINVAVKFRQVTAAASASGSFTNPGSSFSSITALGNVGSFAANNITGGVSLSWGAVANRTAYRVDRATDSGFTTGVALDISPGLTATSLNDTGLTVGTTYYYRIKAVGSGRYSDSASYATANDVAGDVQQRIAAVSGLLHYYKLDETSGTSAADSAGSLTGTHTSVTVNQSPGVAVGKAALYVRASGSRTAMADAADLKGMAAITIGAWIKLTTLPGTSELYTIVGKLNSFYFTIRENAGVQEFNTNLNYGTPQRTAWSPSTGAWTFVAATWSFASGKAKHYVNGAQIGSDITETAAAAAGDTSVPEIGRFAGTHVMNGAIDELFIANTVLTAGELLALYNAGT